MSTKPAAMLWELISRLAKTTLTIRISGEAGVGKEAVARLLYQHYPDQNGNFISFDCRHCEDGTKGTHASSCRCVGTDRFEHAVQNGTATVFFLNHIEALPPRLQIKLLDLIDNGPCRQAPPWIIVASPQPLECLVESQVLDRRLFNALDTIHIALPPLRARPDRIPQILTWLLRQRGVQTNGEGMQMPDAESLQRLAQYHWPGNWRQIQHVVLEAFHSRTWHMVIDTLEHMDAGQNMKIDTMAAIYILATAKLKIRKERVMDGLMRSAPLDEIGLLDLAIFNEAVAQIADQLTVPGNEPDDDVISGS